MSLTSASEKDLLEEPKLSNSLEKDGFLIPIDDISSVSHVGWFSEVEPIFQISDSVATSQQIAQTIVEKAQAGAMESAGLRGFVIPAELSFDDITDVFQDAVVIVKIENWWENCLPNGILGERAKINSYIEERETEMSERLCEKDVVETIALDTHSVFGGEFGQFQFVGWR